MQNIEQLCPINDLSIVNVNIHNIMSFQVKYSESEKRQKMVSFKFETTFLGEKLLNQSSMNNSTKRINDSLNDSLSSNKSKKGLKIKVI